MYTNNRCSIFLYAEGYRRIDTRCFITYRKEHDFGGRSLTYKERCFVMFMGDKNIKFTGGKDFLILGGSNINFMDCTDEKRSRNLDELKALGACTVMVAEYKDYGSKRMRHWEVSCR